MQGAKGKELAVVDGTAALIVSKSNPGVDLQVDQACNGNGGLATTRSGESTSPSKAIMIVDQKRKRMEGVSLDSGMDMQDLPMIGLDESFEAWLSKVIECKEEVAIRGCLALYWSIWKCRNDVVWNHKTWTPTEVLRLSDALVEEWAYMTFKMGSRSTQAEDGSLSKDSGGAHNYTFSLKLSYGGRIHQSIPPKYFEGKVRTFSNLDSDEWGIMTLMDKVIEVGYKKDDHLRFFSRTDNGLIELVNDLETWNLVNNVVKPKVVEIWVITGVDGLEETCDADEVGVIGEEETFNEDEVEVSSEDSDWEERDFANELELFEGSENEIDDQDFVKYVDPNVEYGGVEVEGPRLEVQLPRAVQTVNAENVAMTEDELSHYNSDDGVETRVVAKLARKRIAYCFVILWQSLLMLMIDKFGCNWQE
nr:transposase, MuDR [Ipomoea batatas]